MTAERNSNVKNGILKNSLFRKRKEHLLTRVFLEKTYFFWNIYYEIYIFEIIWNIYLFEIIVGRRNINEFYSDRESDRENPIVDEQIACIKEQICTWVIIFYY